MTDSTANPTAALDVGVVGLGVMGGPMCRNMARKHGALVLAHDLDAELVAAVAQGGAQAAGDIMRL